MITNLKVLFGFKHDLKAISNKDNENKGFATSLLRSQKVVNGVPLMLRTYIRLDHKERKRNHSNAFEQVYYIFIT